MKSLRSRGVPRREETLDVDEDGTMEAGEVMVEIWVHDMVGRGFWKSRQRLKKKENNKRETHCYFRKSCWYFLSGVFGLGDIFSGKNGRLYM